MSVYNKPYIWRMLGNYPNKSILIYDWEIRKTKSSVFTRGRPLPSPQSDVFGSEKDPSTYDLIFESHVPLENLLKWDVLMTNASQIPLINKHALDLLQQICPDDFQVFPTLIHNANKKVPKFECRDYFLLNITKLEDLIDHQKSDKEFFSDGHTILGFKNLRLINQSSHSNLLRLKDYKGIICASPRLVSAFRKAKIKGVKFIKDEEYGIY